MACQKGVPAEACLVLTGRTRHPQQRGQERGTSRTLLPRSASETHGGARSTQPWPRAARRAAPSAHQAAAPTFNYFFLCLAGWQRAEGLFSIRDNLRHVFRQQRCIASLWGAAELLLSPSYPPGTHVHGTWHHWGELLASKIFPAGAGLKALTDPINRLWRNPPCSSDEITTSSTPLEARRFITGWLMEQKGFSSSCTQTKPTSLELSPPALPAPPPCHFILDFKLLILGG